jgi:hypothetical protein
MNRFSCLNLHGGFVAADIIDQIADGTATGQKASDFGLDSKVHLIDEISSAWASARNYWEAFQRRLERLPTEDVATSATRDQWAIPLLSLLGYELTFQARASEVDGQTFAISHRAGPDENSFPIHIVGYRQSLDVRPESGRPRLAPHSLLQEYLNRSEHLWGLVTNGSILRILRNSQLMRRQAYIEFELAQMMEGEKFSDFVLLYRLIHHTRVPKTIEDAPECLFEKYYKLTVEQGGRIRDHLRDGVENALKIVANGLLQHPHNGRLREIMQAGSITPVKFYEELLHLIYRLLFLMVAEERNLLTDNKTYRDFYSISRLRHISEHREVYSDNIDLWQSLQSTFQLFQDEQLSVILEVPPLNGDLFNPLRTAQIDNGTHLTNRDFLTSLWYLSMYRENERTPWRRVNYAALDVEELGSVYESLLDFQPVFYEKDGIPTFDLVFGTERKSTGSYYTPQELVNELIKSALIPVIEDRLKAAESRGQGAESKVQKEKALLNTKICDPACGSGHFLLAAARTIGKTLAQVRTGEDEPTPEQTRLAIRDVITHCIYGVDKNPLAVDLCKVALWIEGHTKGKPLTFIDHRIRCGDSLVGVLNMEVLKEGIPDEAYKVVTGDDVETAKALKKRNREERKGQGGLFFAPEKEVRNLADSHKLLAEYSDDNPKDIREKAKIYEEILREEEKDFHSCNLWTAAFFVELTPENANSNRIPTTETLKRYIERGDIDARFTATTWALAERNKFFHWPLEFPEVMEEGGFDVIISNPPWEKTTTLEREFFASIPEIVNEKRSDRRKKLISQLQDTNPQLYRDWIDQQKTDVKYTNYLRSSLRFPLSAVGELNLYPLFVELSNHLISNNGKAGLVIKTGMMLSPTWAEFSAYILEKGRIESAFDFRNWRGWFPAIGYHERFTLLTLGPGQQMKEFSLGYYLDEPAEIRNSQKVFKLSREEAIMLNPITKTVPAFEGRMHKEIMMKIYKKFPILGSKDAGWGIRYTRGLDMTAEADKLHDYEELMAEGYEPDIFFRMKKNDHYYMSLYEGKLIHQYDHRFASFEGIAREKRFGIKPGTYTPTDAQKKDHEYHIMPRYWISQENTEADIKTRELKGRWSIVFRDTTNVLSNFRTSVACISENVAFNYKAPNIALDGMFEDQRAVTSLLFVSLMNSLPFDYVVRQKYFGANFIKSILMQIAAPPQDIVIKNKDYLLPRALELTYTSWQLKDFALECGYEGPPFVWNEERRLQLRTEIDALFFQMYGLSTDDIEIVLESFPILKAKEVEKYGEYRTRKLVLEKIEKMEK